MIPAMLILTLALMCWLLEPIPKAGDLVEVRGALWVIEAIEPHRARILNPKTGATLHLNHREFSYRDGVWRLSL